MARHAIPRVIDNHLLPPESADASFPPISVGSEAWYAWLSQPTPRSFAFSSPHGTLTARREKRHGTWYWYASRCHSALLHHQHALPPPAHDENLCASSPPEYGNASTAHATDEHCTEGHTYSHRCPCWLG